jgi:hypothetical protein
MLHIVHGEVRVRYPTGTEFFSFLKYPECPLYPMGIKMFLLRAKNGHRVKLTTHHQLVPKLRMRGAVTYTPTHDQNNFKL